MTKLRSDQKLVIDKNTGRARIKQTVNPKLDTSAKIRQKTSKRQRVVKRTVQ